MQDDRSGKVLEHRRRVVVGFAGVNDYRLGQAGGKLELGGEELPLGRAGSAIAEVVEAYLTQRDRARRGEKRLELAEAPGVRAGSLVRMNAEDGEDPFMALGNRDRLAAGIDAGAYAEHRLNSRGARPPD